MKLPLLALFPLFAALAACDSSGDRAGTTPGAAGSAPVAQERPQVPVETKDRSGMLTISPGAIDLCAAVDGVAALEVAWDATSVGTEGIKIYLSNPGEGSEKLWLAAGARGRDKTGAWMREGAVIRLVDGRDEKELAKLSVTSVPCVR